MYIAVLPSSQCVNVYLVGFTKQENLMCKCPIQRYHLAIYVILELYP